jgi:serine protease Do
LGLGCQLFPVTRFFQRAHKFDALVAVQAVTVVPGGPAARAGIRPGDILIQLGEAQLGSIDEIHRRLPTPGTHIAVRVVRPADPRNPNGEGTASTLALKTEERPQEA